jgi:hypothetical protein
MRDDSVQMRIEELLLACIAAVGVDGGGMSLVSATGTRQPLYGSDDTAQVMERLQYTVGEGPCVDATVSGSPVLVPDIDEPGSGVSLRWPAFLAEAAKADLRAVFAFPVRIGAISLGAIDLYRRSPGPLGREDLAPTLTAVDTIAVALLDVAGTLDSGLDTDRVSSMAVHRARANSSTDAAYRRSHPPSPPVVPLHHLVSAGAFVPPARVAGGAASTPTSSV